MILEPRHIEKHGYTVEILKDRIYMVRDFISEDEQAELLALGEMADQEKWESHYMENTKKFALKKFGTDDIESLVRDGKYEITSNWVDKVLKIEDNIISKVLTERLSDLFEELDHLEVNGVGILQRQYEGVPLKAHVDNHTDPSLEYASVIYVNDDYVDGEVFFTHKGVKLKPPARALLLFPTDEEYLHGTEAPGKGPIRYVIPSFIAKKKFYEHNKF
jgi:hypothetical protein